MGASAFNGGLATAALGLLMHFCVATSWAAIFYLVSLKIPALVRHAIVAGLLYGAFVYVVMYFGVIPMSGLVRGLYLPHVTIRFPSFAWQPLIVHLLCVGLPIALVVRRFSAARGA
jgi:hypothetical protein